MGSSVIQIVVTLIIVIVFFYLAYILTRTVAGGRFLGVHGKNIRVLEKLPLSKDTSILLLRAVDKVLVVGVTSAGMTVLRELAPEEVPAEQLSETPPSFGEAFRTALRDTMPTEGMRSRVAKWLHVEQTDKDSNHAKHL